MSLKDLLVHVDNSEAGHHRLEVAVDLARKHEAYLTGLYVLEEPEPGRPVEEPDYPVPDFGGTALKAVEADRKRRRAEETEHARLAAERAEILFREKARAAGIGHEWRAVSGDLYDVLAHEGRFCDIAIVGGRPPEAEGIFSRDAIDHLIVSVGHPVLVIPQDKATESLGERVMIAWDRSPVAHRAIQTARPFLRAARSVTILAINLEPEEHGGRPGSGICEHLARHGIRAEPLRIRASQARISEVILATAEERKADLLVMGAYGHSRLRERIFGGVTYEILGRARLPVLLSH